jgi:hypothetical protein
MDSGILTEAKATELAELMAATNPAGSRAPSQPSKPNWSP